MTSPTRPQFYGHPLRGAPKGVPSEATAPRRRQLGLPGLLFAAAASVALLGGCTSGAPSSNAPEASRSISASSPGVITSAPPNSPATTADDLFTSGQLILLIRCFESSPCSPTDLVRVDPKSGTNSTLATLPSTIDPSQAQGVFVGGHLVLQTDDYLLYDFSQEQGFIQVPGCGRSASGFGTGEDVSSEGYLVQGPDQTAVAVCTWGIVPLKPGAGTGNIVPTGNSQTSYGSCNFATTVAMCYGSCSFAGSDVMCVTDPHILYPMDGSVFIRTVSFFTADGSLTRSMPLDSLLQGTAAAGFTVGRPVAVGDQVYLRGGPPDGAADYLVSLDATTLALRTIKQLPVSPQMDYVVGGSRLVGVSRKGTYNSDSELFVVDPTTLVLRSVGQLDAVVVNSDYAFFKDSGARRLGRFDLATSAITFMKLPDAANFINGMYLVP